MGAELWSREEGGKKIRDPIGANSTTSVKEKIFKIKELINGGGDV